MLSVLAYRVKVGNNFKFYALVELGLVSLVKLNGTFLRQLNAVYRCICNVCQRAGEIDSWHQFHQHFLSSFSTAAKKFGSFFRAQFFVCMCAKELGQLANSYNLN